jgi:1,4-dihydroxy-2-naphthoate polyprenyltransferase
MVTNTKSIGKAHIEATRLPFSTASILPAIIAIIWCWTYESQFSFFYSTIALLGVLFLHLGANTINDYFDWNKSDKINRFASEFSGGSRRTLLGVIPRKTFLILSIVLFTAALALGALLVFSSRPGVLIVGSLGALCGILYSVYPFSFQSRGLGEILIFLAFGPLITLGMGYVATGGFELNYFLIGIPNGFSVLAILWVNMFPDYEADKISGKHNLVVRLGRSKSRYGYFFLISLFYISVSILTALSIFPIWSLVVFATLPLPISLSKKLWINHKKPVLLKGIQAGTIGFQIVTAVIILISFTIPF